MERPVPVVGTEAACLFDRPKTEGAGVGRQHPEVPLVDELRLVARGPDGERIEYRVARVVADGSGAEIVPGQSLSSMGRGLLYAAAEAPVRAFQTMR